jgi:hypothetical protein
MFPNFREHINLKYFVSSLYSFFSPNFAVILWLRDCLRDIFTEILAHLTLPVARRVLALHLSTFDLHFFIDIFVFSVIFYNFLSFPLIFSCLILARSLLSRLSTRYIYWDCRPSYPPCCSRMARTTAVNLCWWYFIDIFVFFLIFFIIFSFYILTFSCLNLAESLIVGLSTRRGWRPYWLYCPPCCSQLPRTTSVNLWFTLFYLYFCFFLIILDFSYFFFLFFLAYFATFLCRRDCLRVVFVEIVDCIAFLLLAEMIALQLPTCVGDVLLIFLFFLDYFSFFLIFFIIFSCLILARSLLSRLSTRCGWRPCCPSYPPCCSQSSRTTSVNLCWWCFIYNFYWLFCVFL